jgi:hypothetical protein
MRSSVILFLSIILFYQPCSGQTKAKITDVDFNLEERYIVVNYNLTGTLPKEQLTIELKFITENNEVISPKTVTGDIGTKVFGDGSKTILWDLVADQVLLSGNLKATINITYSKILYSGASNAFLSVFIPGLGGYFVDKHKGRAVLTTISTIGLMGYGISQKIQADKYYNDYKNSTLPLEMDGLYSKANDYNHKYYTTTRIAAGIWALDIIWVTFKGLHNRKEAKNAYSAFTTDGLRLNYVNNSMQLGYSVTF